MVESAEHQFLSQCATEVLSKLSHTNLYAYVEAERRKFDFACELLRDWSRPLVGQTLWNHVEGVDKDIRTMLLDAEAEICVYVARDTMKAHRLLSEAMSDYRAGGGSIQPHRLRVIWIPQDFDADDENQRTMIAEMLAERVGRDILLNVVLGNLTSEDVRFFVRSSGLPGASLAVLHLISTMPEPHARLRDISDLLGVSQGAVRERLLRLLGCGLLSQFGGGASLASATLKGRVFLDLCGELWRQSSAGHLTAEMLQILHLLDMRYAPSAILQSARSLHLAGPLLTEVPEMVTGRLIATVAVATERWNIDFSTKVEHFIHDERKPYGSWVTGGDPILARLRHESDLYVKRNLQPGSTS
ncbi:helix-turn-helix domain-containing protein [Micromonospora sp. NPDC003241]